MAVNSASDRNNQSDEVRRTREAYQKREAEQAKQQGQQVKHITESAQAELEEVKADHQNQLEDLKSKTRDALSRRDMQYQKDIGELRDMHQKQLQRVAMETENKMDRDTGTLKGEIARVEKTSAQQRDVMKGHYEDELKEKDGAFTEFADNTRTVNQKATTDLKDRLTKTHQKEVKTLVEDRDNRIGEQQRDLREYRRNKDTQIKSMTRQHASDVNRLNDGFEASIKEEKEMGAMTAEESREAMKDGLQRNREKFEKAAEEMRDQSEASREELAGTVGGRIGTHVRALESENRNLRADAVKADVKSSHQKARELSNLRDAMSANIQGLEKTRQETLDSVNDRTRKVIDEKSNENARSLTSTHKFYQEKMADDTLRQDERLMLTKEEAAKTIGHERISSDTRFSRMKNSGDVRETQLRNYFDRASASMKDNFDTTLHTMREANQRDQQTLIGQFTKQSQESDAKLQSRIADIQNKYEKEMAETKEQHIMELKDQSVGAERIRHELEKKSAFELKSQASQYEARIAKLQEAHETSIEAMRAKHEESLANLTTKRKT